jgi:hypothetical protein
MSAKEELVVEVESAKERIAEVVTEVNGVIERIAETQSTVEAVMGEPDQAFADAAEKLRGAAEAVLAVNDQLDEAINLINSAGQQSSL